MPSNSANANSDRLMTLWQYNRLRWFLQTVGPFAGSVLAIAYMPSVAWLPAAIAPISVNFVPPLGHRRFPGPLIRALASNMAAANLIALNAIAIFVAFVALIPAVPLAKPLLLSTALVTIIVYLGWCLSSRHPVRRLFYWPRQMLSSPHQCAETTA